MRLRQKQREQVNNAANLIRCYETVPSQYFDEDFMFNFQYNFIVLWFDFEECDDDVFVFRKMHK